MNWQDLCCMCCGDRQAFWDKLARQATLLGPHICALVCVVIVVFAGFAPVCILQRYRYCANGDCTEDPTHQIPGQNNEAMDTDTFLMMGFLILPLLFVMWGMFQRMNGRRRELPPGKHPRDGPNRDEGPPTPPVD